MRLKPEPINWRPQNLRAPSTVAAPRMTMIELLGSCKHGIEMPLRHLFQHGRTLPIQPPYYDGPPVQEEPRTPPRGESRTTPWATTTEHTERAESSETRARPTCAHNWGPLSWQLRVTERRRSRSRTYSCSLDTPEPTSLVAFFSIDHFYEGAAGSPHGDPFNCVRRSAGQRKVGMSFVYVHTSFEGRVVVGLLRCTTHHHMHDLVPMRG
ncbi:hypothetical protein F5I97DRAFT_831751 [Phlebopus sp. FC_14]|nr:hypothetical protein F5I97DRAFT_831751 [Phlebopus sp. FC_14]